MQQAYRNEPFTDFSQERNRQLFQQALEQVNSQLGKSYGIRIGGEAIHTSCVQKSINPANKEEVVGFVSQADIELAERAILTAAGAFERWKKVSGSERAKYIYKTAAIMRKRKHELSAWMVYEAGKSWQEADIDTAEAIDFLEFYGREMERLSERQPLERISGEDNELAYIPLGVGVIIPPWNFPLAIMAGMTTAAIVTGNTVVLKPASPTPVIAAKFIEILQEAGVPDDVVQFLPGPGAEVGDYLVDHPLTRFVNFTGSRDVGLRINERAAKTQSGQKWIKRVVAEMGGKDTIIVDADCDLELAAESIVLSAFGFSGQKCSACSRAVIVDEVYEALAQKVRARAATLTMGDPTVYSNYMGPVIDERAYLKITEYIEIGKQEGKLLQGGGTGSLEGYFIEPTVFGDVSPTARIAQEEIFGPVVALIRAKDFDEALDIANNTEYGLTGAVISRNRERLGQARETFHVGNLYFNRKCTGALVGVHPFGGFNMSGTDSKAGGRDYLLLFLQAKLVSEKY